MKKLFPYISRIVFIVFIMMPVLYACNSQESLLDSEVDSTKVVEQSLQYIFKTNTFAPTYYTQPIRIIKSANVPSGIDISINGKKCELVDKPAKFYTDVFKPIPYVEVEKLKFNTVESAEVDLIFPATGHWFMLELKKQNSRNWKVVKISEATI